MLNWNNTEIVIVTGDKPNFCGHMLISIGNEYYHFDGPSFLDYPKRLGNYVDYKNYLARTNKYELMRQRVHVPLHKKAEKRLEELLSKKWGTALFAHNCATFVKEILQAGGNYYAFLEFCPKGNFIIKDLIDKYVR